MEGSRNLSEAVSATTSVLRSAGIGVPATSRADSEPAAGISLGAYETMQVARDGRRRSSIGRITLDEFAFAMQQAGVPFATELQDGWVRAPGSGLRNFLADAVTSALQHPDDPAAQPALLLAALARRQTPAIDLTDRHYDPTLLQLTHLDLLLIDAIFAHVAPVYRADQPPPSSSRASARADGPAATPCSDFKSYLEKKTTIGDVAFAYGSQKVVSAYMNAAAANYLDLVGVGAEAAEKALGSTLAALGVLAKAQGIALLYSTAQAELDTSLDAVEKPQPGQAAVPVLFTVRAGVPDDEWAEYKATQPSDELNSLRDCAAFVGLPTWSTAADIAGTIEKWRVEWFLEEGSGFHALIAAGETYDFAGRLAEFLHRRDDHTGTEDITVDILPARRRGTGPQLVEPVTMRAEIATDVPPNTLMWISAVEAKADPVGLVGPVADLVTGFIQNLATIDARKTVNVSFAHPGVWYGRIVERISNGYGVTFSSYDSGPGGSFNQLNTSQRRTEQTVKVTQIGAAEDPEKLGVTETSTSDSRSVSTGASRNLAQDGICVEHQYDVRETAERSLSRIVATVPPPEVAADGLLTPASLHDPDALIEGPGTFSTESSQSESYDKVGLGNNARCESIGDSFGDNSLTPHSADPGYTLDYWVSGRPTREGGEDVWRHESERSTMSGDDLRTRHLTVELRRRSP